MTKTKKNYATEGQVVVLGRAGDKHGAVGVIIAVDKSSIRVEFKISPQGIPYKQGKTTRYALTALAPKALDILDVVPELNRAYAFVFPLENAPDVTDLVEAHRQQAELEKNAIQTGFFMIAGVHGDIRYDLNARSCPSQPPVKKYLDQEEAISDAEEMCANYNNSYVVLAVAAVVRPKSAEEVKAEVVTEVVNSQGLLEAKK